MWLQFEWPSHVREAMERSGGVIGIIGDGPPVFSVGCGVSGYDEDDCLALIREGIFAGRPLPEIHNRVPDIDVSTLPEDVQEQLGNPASRGVWFPPLNLRPSL
jgi:hypothetical protein